MSLSLAKCSTVHAIAVYNLFKTKDQRHTLRKIDTITDFFARIKGALMGLSWVLKCGADAQLATPVHGPKYAR